MVPRNRRRRRKYAKPSRLSDLVGSHTSRWRWAKAAGEYMARHAVPVRLVRRTLRVAVPDSSWAAEMIYLAGPILERLQKMLKGAWVEEIKPVLVDSIPDSPPVAREIKLPEPTEEMNRRADRAVKDVADENLRESMRRAVLASLRRLDAEASNAVDKEQVEPPNGEQS